MRYWHDAKGRALFVVTPRRHVRNLAELTPREHYQLWRGAIQVGWLVVYPCGDLYV